MTSAVLSMSLPVAAGLAIEHYVLRTRFPILYETSNFAPKAYAGVILVNVIGSSIVLITLGFRVASARRRYTEEAERKGDKDAIDRFSYPKLYAEGFTEEAKKFNCVQRGHQQTLETYSQFLALSLLGGLSYPIVSVIGGILWNYGRLQWASGYSSGDPSKRYEHWSSRWIWNGLLVQLATSAATAISIAMGK